MHFPGCATSSHTCGATRPGCRSWSWASCPEAHGACPTPSPGQTGSLRPSTLSTTHPRCDHYCLHGFPAHQSHEQVSVHVRVCRRERERPIGSWSVWDELRLDAHEGPIIMVGCPPACQGEWHCGGSATVQLGQSCILRAGMPTGGSASKYITCGAELTGLDNSTLSTTLLPVWRALLRVRCDERRRCQRRTP